MTKQIMIERHKPTGRYGFAVADENDKVLFSSWRDFFLVPGLRSQYKAPWRAHADASLLIRHHSHHLDAIEKYAREDLQEAVVVDMSAERRLSDHYDFVLSDIFSKIKGLKGEDITDQDEEQIFQEALMVRNEIKFLIENIGSEGMGEMEGMEEEKGKLSKKLRMLEGKMKARFPKLMREQEKKEKEAEEAAAQAAQVPPGGDMGMGMPGGDMGMGDMGMGMPGGDMGMGDPGGGAFAGLKSRYVTASKLDDDLSKEVYQNFAEKACEVLEKKHPEIDYDIEGQKIILRKADKDDPILQLDIDEDLNLDNIIPLGSTAKQYPSHSWEFYQRYWKPVVEAIGHIYLDDQDSLLVVGAEDLPDLPKSAPLFHELTTWNLGEKQITPVGLEFAGNDNKTWLFKTVDQMEKSAAVVNPVSRYTEEDYRNSIVRCIDPLLKSLHEEDGTGRTGQVIQVIPRKGNVEIDIDFGRGLGIVRLTEDQIEIVLGS